jgi:hypothetical protein
MVATPSTKATCADGAGGGVGSGCCAWPGNALEQKTPRRANRATKGRGMMFLKGHGGGFLPTDNRKPEEAGY